MVPAGAMIMPVGNQLVVRKEVCFHMLLTEMHH